MDSIWWDFFVVGLGIMGDFLQLALLLWLAWREMGRIVEEKIREAIRTLPTEQGGTE